MKAGLDPWTSAAVVVWEDATAWIWARRLKKKVGSVFKGELRTNIWDVDPSAFVSRFERTLDAVRRSDKDAVFALWLA